MAMNLTSAQVSAFRDGLDSVLTNIQSQLAASVFAESLPVVGGNLQTLAVAATPNAANAGLQKFKTLKTALDTKLASLAGSGGTDAAVLKAVNDALAAEGFSTKAKGVGGDTFLVDLSDVSGASALPADVDGVLGMPGLGLSLAGAATAKGTVNYGLNFSVGLNGAGGFVMQTSDANELDVSLDVDAGAFKNVAASMGNLPYTVSAVDTNLLTANFAVELDSSGAVTSATVASGAATPQLQLKTSFGAGAAMPGVGSTLKVDWDIAGATVNSDPDNSAFGSVPQVDFNNIGLDPGSFVNGVAKKFFDSATTYLGPVIDVCTKLATPIPGVGPILAKLGLGGTLIDILAGPGSPAAETVKDIAQLGNIAKKISAFSNAGGTLVDFGSFGYTLDGNGADVRNPAFLLSTVTPNLTSSGAGVGGNAGLSGLSSMLTSELGGGLHFPILEGSAEVFKFVLGQTATLATYNPGPVSVGLDYSKSVPIFPGVNVGIAVGGSVNLNVEIGYDTSGVADFANGGFADLGKLFNGFFLTDFAGLPEVSFDARIGATASLGIPGIAEGGVEGGIRGTVIADYKDDFAVPGHPELANDGKLSFLEIQKQLQSSVSPLGLFDISGRIDAYLSAYLEFLFYSKHFDLGAITLFDFEAAKAAAANQPAPLLASLSGEAVRIHTGPNAAARNDGLGDIGESIRLRPQLDAKGNLVDVFSVVVSSADTTDLAGNALPFLGGDVTLKGKKIIGDGGAGNDVLRASDDVRIPINYEGGAGNDFVHGGFGSDTLGGGLGDDQVFGGKGNDVIGGDDSNDQLYGGEQNDTLSGGPGNDLLMGDEGNDTLYGFFKGFTQNTGNDSLFGGAGNDSLVGSAGNDTLDGGPGIDTLVGGGGLDVFVVDDAKDVIIADVAFPLSPVRSRATTYSLSSGLFVLELTSDLSEDGTEVIHKAINGFGNNSNNRITGNDAANVIGGLGGNDTLLGGDGDDLISGGDGDDSLEGGEGNDTLLGGAGNDTIFGDDGDDYLDGGSGNDNLFGGNGDDAYTVNDGDTITDTAGFDLVSTPDSVDLNSEAFIGIEGVFLTGAKNSNASGTGDANRLIGNAGKNKLSGLGGVDTLEGGLGDTLLGGDGNDLYYVNDSGVKIIEQAGEGTADIVFSSVSFTLPAKVEKLTLTRSEGARTATGNDGDNQIIAQKHGTVKVDGKAGDDLILARSLYSTLSATIYGGVGRDTILGSNFDDVLYGNVAQFSSPSDFFPDDDSISGGDGNDTIYGGDGVDTLIGGDGNDEIHTQAREITTLMGGLGDDVYVIDDPDGIFNVLSIDESNGGGVDTVRSIVDVDFRALRPNSSLVVSGAVENIELIEAFFKVGKTLVLKGATFGRGSINNNRITGNSLDNTLEGFAGQDTLIGGAGNDTLNGDDVSGSARDELYGGKGNDTFIINDTKDVVVEFLNEGTDTVQAEINFTLPQHVENLFLNGAAVSGIGNGLGNVLRGNASANTLSGLFGNDTILGGNGGDTILAGPGDDVVRGQDGDDVIDGGEGKDLLVGNDGGDTIRGGGDDDKIFGQAEFNTGGPDYDDDGANDVLFGDDGNDSLIGFGGNDWLDGGNGDDGMSGGTGSDTYIVDSAGDKVFEVADAGYDEVLSSVTFTIPANVESLVLTGVANINAFGSKADDTLRGNSGNNTVAGLAGFDVLYGGEGNDVLYGGDDADFLYGDLGGMGTGNDTLDGGKGDDAMFGDGGNDVYRVDSPDDAAVEEPNRGHDRVETTVSYALFPDVEDLVYVGSPTVGAALTGNDSANLIVGGNARDTLDGGAGIDTLIGGGGDDTYHVDRLDDRISEAVNGGNDAIISHAAEYVLPGNVENFGIADDAPPSSSYFGLGRSIGTGNGLANVMLGNADPNILFGETGNDTLLGNGGDDILFGGDGNDSINGGAGADTLDGGAGNDTYLIDTLDSINDFAGEGYDKAIAQVTGCTLTPGSYTEELQLAAIADVVSGFGNELANVITGNAFANTLGGGAGPDTLNGGGGDDDLTGANPSTLGVGEIDTFIGGPGADHIFLTSGTDIYYDDGSALAGGLGDFAWIKDFKPSEGDRVVLPGFTAGSFLFAPTSIPGGSSKGIGLFRDTDGDHVFDDPFGATAPDELLAFFEGMSVAPTEASALFFLAV